MRRSVRRACWGISSSWLILPVSWLLRWRLSILIGRLLAICIRLLLERRRTRYRAVPRHTPLSNLPMEIHDGSKRIEFEEKPMKADGLLVGRGGA